MWPPSPFVSATARQGTPGRCELQRRLLREDSRCVPRIARGTTGLARDHRPESREVCLHRDPVRSHEPLEHEAVELRHPGDEERSCTAPRRRRSRARNCPPRARNSRGSGTATTSSRRPSGTRSGQIGIEKNQVLVLDGLCVEAPASSRTRTGRPAAPGHRAPLSTASRSLRTPASTHPAAARRRRRRPRRAERRRSAPPASIPSRTRCPRRSGRGA